MPETAPKILLFSRPIRSGKTTELHHAFSGKKGVGGFLTPDRDGLRMLYELATGHWHPFEIPENADGLEPVVVVGKFRFAESVFQQATQLFREEKLLFVVDEVGKLEVLQNRGLEPELSALIRNYQSGSRTGVLLLIVRDTLLEEAIQKYGLQQVPVCASLDALQKYLPEEIASGV